MSALTPEERKANAKAAADKRWAAASLPKATHGSPDQPLRIGGMEIDCYVLDDGTRVITQRSMIRSMGLTRGGVRSDIEADKGVGAELPRFAAQNWIKDHVDSDLRSALSKPVVFKPPLTGVAYGYPATILTDVCDAILKARDAGDAGPRQAGIVKQADILVRGLARVGTVSYTHLTLPTICSV